MDDGSVPMVVWWHTALYLWFIGHYCYFSLCVQKIITFTFVSMLSLSDYDRKEDMIRVSLATISICNGPLFIWEFHSIKLQVIQMLIEGYERIRNSGLLMSVLELWGRLWWLTPEGLDLWRPANHRWYQPIQVMEEPMPPLPSIAATTPLL